MRVAQVTRRGFLRKVITSAAGLVGVPVMLRAQPRPIKVGMVEPVTGPMADVGQDSRLGAQMAVESINAAGGITSMGGARIELLLWPKDVAEQRFVFPRSKL